MWRQSICRMNPMQRVSLHLYVKRWNYTCNLIFSCLLLWCRILMSLCTCYATCQYTPLKPEQRKAMLIIINCSTNLSLIVAKTLLHISLTYDKSYVWICYFNLLYSIHKIYWVSVAILGNGCQIQRKIQEQNPWIWNYVDGFVKVIQLINYVTTKYMSYQSHAMSFFASL
jgi:hypothetical protein